MLHQQDCFSRAVSNGSVNQEQSSIQSPSRLPVKLEQSKVPCTLCVLSSQWTEMVNTPRKEDLILSPVSHALYLKSWQSTSRNNSNTLHLGGATHYQSWASRISLGIRKPLATGLIDKEASSEKLKWRDPVTFLIRNRVRTWTQIFRFLCWESFLCHPTSSGWSIRLLPTLCSHRLRRRKQSTYAQFPWVRWKCMQFTHHTATSVNINGVHRSACKRSHHVVFRSALSLYCIIKMTFLGVGGVGNGPGE